MPAGQGTDHRRIVDDDVTPTPEGSFGSSRELHSGQLFPDEGVTTEVAAPPGYAAGTVPRTALPQDGVHDGGVAPSGLPALIAPGSPTAAGYAGTLTLGVETG